MVPDTAQEDSSAQAETRSPRPAINACVVVPYLMALAALILVTPEPGFAADYARVRRSNA